MSNTEEVNPKEVAVELSEKVEVFKKNSVKLLDAFSPIRTLLKFFGRLPFEFKSRSDGAPYIRFAPKTVGYMYFFISSLFAAVVFFMMILGFLTMFMDIGSSTRFNTCMYTWEIWELKKYCVLVSLAVTWMLLTVIGSIFLINHGHLYIHYFNYWFMAVDIMDMDVTIEGVKKGAISGNVLMLTMVGSFIVLYIAGIAPSLNEGSGAVANSIIRLFVPDIFYTEVQKERVHRNAGRKPGEQRESEYCGVFSTFDSYAQWKLFGFSIQLYAIFGSRVFIAQFRFFSRILRNGVSIWNSRLKHALEGGLMDTGDQRKKRIDFKLLLKDHMILVQLYRMTETCFALVIQSFYFVQVANVGFQLYFFSQVGTVDTCNQYIEQLRSANNSECQRILEGFESFKNNPNSKFEIIEIDEHICGNKDDSLYNTLLALSLFIQTILIFTSTTNSASDAYEQAAEGFGIVRRHGFLLSKSRKERNFIHCLIVSFARNNPMILSAAGYFTVSRPLTLVVIASIANYYIILLQFKPGELDNACASDNDMVNKSVSNLTNNGS